MSRFSACPRKGHLSRLLRIFGYLKKYKNRRIVVNSNDPIVIGEKDVLELNFQDLLQNQYPDAVEEIDCNVPKPLVEGMEITPFVDSDHAHDKVTRRSITGLLILVGSTPIYFLSKHQGAIATSTYGAELTRFRNT